MPAIPYVPMDIREPEDIVTAVRKRRGGTLLNLDRMLLHSPPFTEGWNALLGATRSALSLSPLLRELAICAVGKLNHAPYEVIQHAEPFRIAGGNDAQLQALDDCHSAARNSILFDASQRAVLNLTVAMTLDVRVTPDVFNEARQVLVDDQQMVELVGVIATYNMVSRFLVALNVEPE